MAFEWNGEKILHEADRAIERGLDILANDIAKSAQQSMREPKSGNPGPRNQRSAPYEAPAVQFGDLIRSVHYERTGKYGRKIGTNMAKGLYLEVGTSRMVERPWLRPALYKHTGRTGEEIFEGLMK